MSANAVDDVNLLGNKDGLTYERKAIILCEIALNVDGSSEQPQIKTEFPAGI